MTAPTKRKIFDAVGESRDTRDGVSRQHVILRCNPGDQVSLERQPDNPHDPNAVLILCAGGDVGFLCREDAALVSPALDVGTEYRAQVHKIKGGVPDAPTYGLQLAIAWVGQKLPVPIELDDVQIKSRRGKLATEGRGRSAKGTFQGSEKSGCLGMLLIIALPAFMGLFSTI
ncbi:MAG: HIRAN domain-containing protein [Croceibacterium sp.]